ncbi:MAG: cell division protein FtsA [Pseudomonadota bacterium]
MGGERVLGLIDLGSRKVGCLIVAVGPAPLASSADRAFNTYAGGGGADRTTVRVLGQGYTGSAGIKAGVIMDMGAAEGAVRTCVAQAEAAAGLTIRDVHVAVSCGRLASQSFAAHADVGTAGVLGSDISRALSGGHAYARRHGRVVMHMNTIGYRIDGEPCGVDPRGLAADRLTADLHAVTADEGPIQNVLGLMQRCHLAVEKVVAAPFASGLAASRGDERRLGVTVIDLGAGVTTLSIFADRQLIHVDAIAVGGDRLTYDIAKAFQTPLAQAERIKALYGTVLEAQSDSREIFAFETVGDRGGHLPAEAVARGAGEGASQNGLPAMGLRERASKAELRLVITPYVRWLLGQVRDRLSTCPVAALGGDHVVLTGGMAQLVGLEGLAADVLNRPVRIGMPGAVDGIRSEFCSPASSCLLGLAESQRQGALQAYGFVGEADGAAGAAGYFERVGKWLVGTG